MCPIFSTMSNPQIPDLYCDSRGFSSLSFLIVHLVGSHTKEYFRTIFIPVTQNIIHCGGLNTFSESLFLWLGLIFALYFHCTSPILSPISVCDPAGRPVV